MIIEKFKNNKFWTYFVLSMYGLGVAYSFLFPYIARALDVSFPTSPLIDSPLFIFPVVLCGVIPIIGIVLFLIRGKVFTKREKINLPAILGLLMLFSIFILIVDKLLLHQEIFISDSLFWGISFGLALFLFKIEKEFGFLIFFLPATYLWVFYPLGGIPLGITDFWFTSWFWSDQIVNFGFGIFTIITLSWAAIKFIHRKIQRK